MNDFRYHFIENVIQELGWTIAEEYVEDKVMQLSNGFLFSFSDPQRLIINIYCFELPQGCDNQDDRVSILNERAQYCGFGIVSGYLVASSFVDNTFLMRENPTQLLKTHLGNMHSEVLCLSKLFLDSI